VEQLLRDGTNKRTRDVLGTVALSAVAVVVGGMLVAGYVWVVPLAKHLPVRQCRISKEGIAAHSQRFREASPSLAG
jgi:hypothetical protein